MVQERSCVLLHELLNKVCPGEILAAEATCGAEPTWLPGASGLQQVGHSRSSTVL